MVMLGPRCVLVQGKCLRDLWHIHPSQSGQSDAKAKDAKDAMMLRRCNRSFDCRHSALIFKVWFRMQHRLEAAGRKRMEQIYEKMSTECCLEDEPLKAVLILHDSIMSKVA